MWNCSEKSSSGKVPAMRAVRGFSQVMDSCGRSYFVGDLADDLLEQVLEGHEALGGAVLVEHDRHLLVRAPEFREQRTEVLGLWDERHAPQ